MNVRRSIASRDALDFHPAWPHSSCGDWLDYRHRDAHHGGWPVRKPDHAKHFRDLLPECFLGASSPHHKMSPRNRALFFLTAWLIVLMPFLFWWNTWFGRQLSDKQIGEFLNDEKHPRHIQHALVQLGEHMGRNDPGVKPLYPELIRLAWHPVEEVRNTDAWVMGQDTSGTGFHEALLKMLEDSSPMVRGNAALSLVRFGDASGRAQIVALLQSARIIVPRSGRRSAPARTH